MGGKYKPVSNICKIPLECGGMIKQQHICEIYISQVFFSTVHLGEKNKFLIYLLLIRNVITRQVLDNNLQFTVRPV